MGSNEVIATALGGRGQGISAFRRLPLDNPFNILYEAAP